MIGRQGEDAGQIVALDRLLLLGEVAHHVGAVLVDLRQHVEEKRVDIEVQRFVVQEHLPVARRENCVFAFCILHVRMRVRVRVCTWIVGTGLNTIQGVNEGARDGLGTSRRPEQR